MAAVAALYACVDPMNAQWMPKCMIYSFTGIKCPGCGTQRALHALFTGDIAGMVRANPILPFVLPLVAIYIYAEVNRVKRPRLFLALNSGRAVWCVVAVTIGWMIVRNIFGL